MLRFHANPDSQKKFFYVLFTLYSALSLTVHAQNISHGISAAYINVVQHDQSNTTSSVTATTAISINDFKMRDGSNRGDYDVQVGPGFSDDVTSGIMMSCVAQNGRDNTETNNPGLNFCTTSIDYAHGGANSGAYFLSTFNAPFGTEYNINAAAAFFPYNQWLGGLARNSGETNGGDNNLFTGSPGLVLGTHFVDQGGGVSIIDLTSLSIDSQTDGILLVTGGKNEDNYALSKVNTNGTWTVYLKDNGSDAANYEQDPVAFVYVPKTNTTVVSGRFRGDGVPLIFSGLNPLFNVTNISEGTWRLTIPSFSPSNGVLIISAEGGFSQNQDNIVSYEPNSNGWIIESRDLPSDPPNLQTPGNGSQPVASFVFIPAATTVSLVSPAFNATNRGPSPRLQVALTNTASGDLTVQFYGRIAPANPGTDFMIVALPDTQFYVSSLNGGLPEMFYSQAEWIITNRVAKNIAYVTQLGDITQNGDLISGNANKTEWRNATNAMYRLENPIRTLLTNGIPYGVAVGNHDEEPIGDSTGTTTFYNQYFGISHFTGKGYYAGHYGTNNDNHFDLFSAGGMDFITLYFKYDDTGNTNALAWGDQVLATNQNRRAIIVTHNFGNTQTPVTFTAQGAAIYNTLKHNTNIFMMLAGHVTGAGSRVDTYNGNTIRTFVSDYQGWTNGGDGFMRLMTFSPTNNQVVVQTYSPWTDEYKTESNHEFFFDYNMQPPAAPFVWIGAVSNLSGGNIASVVWSNRQANVAYEWFTVVTDALGNRTTNTTWRFSTTTNSAPTANNQFQSIIGDSPTNLTLTAFDANGDALTFQLDSLPLHGVNRDFDPLNGVVTYVPVRGYRGFDQFNYRASDGVASTAIITLNLQVVSPPDLNSNNIPDAWESAYGITNPNADNDGDGQSNLEEYLANTNPTNAASVLHISSASRKTNGHITVTWPSIGGTRYRVQFSAGETNGAFNGIFTDIARPLNLEMDPAPYNAPSVQTFIDDFTPTGAATNRARFYRIKIVQ